MAVAVVLLAAGYMTIGAFTGFSLLLCIAVLLASYGLFDSSFGTRQENKGGGSIVS